MVTITNSSYNIIALFLLVLHSRTEFRHLPVSFLKQQKPCLSFVLTAPKPLQCESGFKKSNQYAIMWNPHK